MVRVNTVNQQRADPGACTGTMPQSGPADGGIVTSFKRIIVFTVVALAIVLVVYAGAIGFDIYLRPVLLPPPAEALDLGPGMGPPPPPGPPVP